MSVLLGEVYLVPTKTLIGSNANGTKGEMVSKWLLKAPVRRNIFYSIRHNMNPHYTIIGTAVKLCQLKISAECI